MDKVSLEMVVLGKNSRGLAKIIEINDPRPGGGLEIDDNRFDRVTLNGSPSQGARVLRPHRIKQFVLLDHFELTELAFAHDFKGREQSWFGARASPKPNRNNQQCNPEHGEPTG